MASHQRQQPSSHGRHPHINNTTQQPPNTIRNPNLNQNGGNNLPPGVVANGDGDLYQQLIDSNDLVKELDDIEAISQQISQHAEVLYQSWKQQEANKQQQQQYQHQPQPSSYGYKNSNTLPSNKSSTVGVQHASSSTGSLPRTSGYQPGDFTRRATSPLKIHENGGPPVNTNNGGGPVPYHKQNGNHNPEPKQSMVNDKYMPASQSSSQNDTPVAYHNGQKNLPYQNIRRQTLPNSNMMNSSNINNPLSSSASGLASPSFISSASGSSLQPQRSNTLPNASRSNSTPSSYEQFHQPTSTQINTTLGQPPSRATILPNTSNMINHNSSNQSSSNLLSEGTNNKSNGNNPKSSSETANVGRSLELLATPEVNGNLKDLVNSFVSTDRAKQAARQTISTTINNMSRRSNGNGIRSPSPSNTASSSPFSSRGVSPLRSPMLAAASNSSGPQAVLSSLHAISSPPQSTTSTSSLSSINTNLQNPPSSSLNLSGPLSPSASSTSSTTSSIDSQLNRSTSATASSDPTSNVHTKLNPMFSRHSSTQDGNNQPKISSMSASPSAASTSWPSDQNTIPIPVQHIRINEAGKPASSSTLMMTGSNEKVPLNSNNLRSPRVLQNLSTTTSSNGGISSNTQLQPPTRQTSLEFSLQPPNLSSLHDQHIESMRHKFEEAKQRMNLLHQRVRSGSDAGLISSSRPPGLSMRSPFDMGGDPFDVDTVDGGSDDPSNHSSYLFDQFRRRVARSKRETPSAPHPELTPQQRQHIFERTSSTGSILSGGNIASSLNPSSAAPNRRFLSGGSVADRVLMFERSPFAMDGRSLSTGSLLEKKKEANVPNWKSSQDTHKILDAQQKAQVNRGIGGHLSPPTASSPSVSPKIRDIPIIKADSSTSTTVPSLSSSSPSLITPHEKPGPVPLTPATSYAISTPSAARPVSPPLTPFKPASLLSSSSSPITNSSSPAASNSLASSGFGLSTTSSTAVPHQLGSRSNSTSPASTLSRVSTPHTIQSASSRPASIIITGKEKVLPRFHFPYGNPVLNPYSDGNLPRFSEEFRKHKNSSATLDELGDILKVCGYPRSWKGIVFTASGGDLSQSLPNGNSENTKSSDGESTNEPNLITTNTFGSINRNSVITLSQFSELWRKMCHDNHDEASQFFYIVTKASDIASNSFSAASDNPEAPNLHPYLANRISSDFSTSNLSSSQHPNSSSFNNNNFNNSMNNQKILNGGSKNGPIRGYLTPEDLVILIQDVVDSHPGLGFLKEATEFHSRYVHTVIARIFYVVNRSWSGRLTISELRRSNFLATLHLLDEEEDINAVTDYFSYEHFYVIYCKFWELDKDHDLFIDREDLARHNDHAISTRMIDRIFSGTVTHGAAQKEGKMSYTEFVWFLLAEEDKRNPTSIEYWFRCMDLDGDGYLSMYELEYFYEEQLQRMEQLGIETLPFEDCLCQMLDMIGPKKANLVCLSDLRNCPMTPIFFDTFFNLEKYLDHEQRDPFASQRDMDEDGNEMSDWDRFAAEEYELLVAEEGNADGTMDELCYEEDGDSNPEMMMEQALDNELMFHPQGGDEPSMANSSGVQTTS